MIRETDWDVLIILDACRYDYFEKFYQNYLKGLLKKVLSPASHTTEWRKKVFEGRDFKDVIYISANPYINSKTEITGFDARGRFSEIVDIWDSGWDENLGTAHPNEVSRELRKKLRKSNDKRIIAHYIQPHAPYIGLDIGEFGRSIPPEKGWSLDWILGRSLSWIERKVFLPLCVLRWMYLFRLSLGIGAGAERETFARKGLKDLRRSYERNLKLVLTSVSRLISQGTFKGKNVIITSDHGELLGDKMVTSGAKNRFSHVSRSGNPKLREVPWLEVH